MKLKQIVAGAIAVLISVGANAHALWIETAATGKKGQAQEVKVFYGEYAEGERDSVAKWYSDVRALTLWLIAPDGTKSQLNHTKEINCLKAGFTPTQEGNYILSISHSASDYEKVRYQFNTNAMVTVGKSPAPAYTGNDIHVTAHLQTGSKTPVKIQAFLNGTPAPGTHVEIVSPNGWKKTFVADSNGEVGFTPTWKGRYMVEITNTEKKAGEMGGKKFESTWRCSTNSFVW